MRYITLFLAVIVLALPLSGCESSGKHFTYEPGIDREPKGKGLISGKDGKYTIRTRTRSE